MTVKPAVQTDKALLVAGEGELRGFAHAAGGPALGDGFAAGDTWRSVANIVKKDSTSGAPMSAG